MIMPSVVVLWHRLSLTLSDGMESRLTLGGCTHTDIRVRGYMAVGLCAFMCALMCCRAHTQSSGLAPLLCLLPPKVTEMRRRDVIPSKEDDQVYSTACWFIIATSRDRYWTQTPVH